jgi:hypothetical protein
MYRLETALELPPQNARKANNTSIQYHKKQRGKEMAKIRVISLSVNILPKLTPNINNKARFLKLPQVVGGSGPRG